MNMEDRCEMSPNDIRELGINEQMTNGFGLKATTTNKNRECIMVQMPNKGINSIRSVLVPNDL